MESRDIARAALNMALSPTREAEQIMKDQLAASGIRATAVNYGGEFMTSLPKLVERAVVASKREQLIENTHHAEGAVAGATREALVQVMPKAMGLNVGGKLGIARGGPHVAIAIFFGIGLLHLNDVAVGLGHRAI